ncbi:hypothetical protein [Flagellimonas crocea]|uniref:hypothetical protein n=1 Tax=Flagellimonas crocea TaxID=3067311 RepID=UPI00296F4331|nr:hypothetical protein [Muricauda sp. DH64]
MRKSLKERLVLISLGIVYLWFGALKFVPNLSPAEDLAKNTIHQLTMGTIPDKVSIVLLAIWEVALGLMFVFGLFRKRAVIMALVHMIFTFSPLFFFPDDVFGEGPLSLTLVGQYIMKNLIIIAALISIYERKGNVVEQKISEDNKRENLLSLPILIGKNLFKKV